MSLREIADVVMKASPAEQTEVVVTEQDDNLTRFANNAIHQNVAERNAHVVVRSVIGRRVGMAISNHTDKGSLERLARRAFDLARIAPENHDFKGLPTPGPLTGSAVYDPGTGECLPEERATQAGIICRKAAAAGYSAAGSVHTIAFRLGVANSLGVFVESRTSIADISTVIMAADSSGWAQSSGTRLDALDAGALADEAIGKVRIGANPSECIPGEYTVILDPYATADLMSMLAFDGMGAISFQEERSWLNGRVGHKIMADAVTIVDDGLNPAGIPAPFDYEGVPRKRVAIVEFGVARTPVYDSYTASREPGRDSTGHATPPSPLERIGPLPMNLFLGTGSSSVEEMIRTTKLGLYITRFWYTRQVHPRDAVITGMTRDGTFVVKDGEIAYPVKSLRFTQSYVEALKNAEAIGSLPRTQWADMMTITVPAIKINQFRFTSGTR
jgi:PmbA protein